jgi:hypothetical protein
MGQCLVSESAARGTLQAWTQSCRAPTQTCTALAVVRSGPGYGEASSLWLPATRGAGPLSTPRPHRASAAPQRWYAGMAKGCLRSPAARGDCAGSRAPNAPPTGENTGVSAVFAEHYMRPRWPHLARSATDLLSSPAHSSSRTPRMISRAWVDTGDRGDSSPPTRDVGTELTLTVRLFSVRSRAWQTRMKSAA